jgi:hypothetical protein
VVSGARHYQGHTSEISTILNQLSERYEVEGIAMPYTMEDFRRDYVRDHLDLLPPEERLRGLSPEERLRGLSLDEIERALERRLEQRKPRDH